MNRSDNIGQLIGALAAAQAKFKAVTKDRNASIQSKTGGSFRYSYADLATGIGAVKDALAANGLAVVQPARLGEGVITVTTLLAHSSGEWISEEMSWPVASTDNRSIGSGITYARRHSLLAMVGAAATDEDDDAESARGGDHDTAHPEPRRQAPKAKPHAEAPAPLTVSVLWDRFVTAYGETAKIEWKAAWQKAGLPEVHPDKLTPTQIEALAQAMTKT
jgi:hypothetical protein